MRDSPLLFFLIMLLIKEDRLAKTVDLLESSNLYSNTFLYSYLFLKIGSSLDDKIKIIRSIEASENKLTSPKNSDFREHQ